MHGEQQGAKSNCRQMGSGASKTEWVGAGGPRGFSWLEKPAANG